MDFDGEFLVTRQQRLQQLPFAGCKDIYHGGSRDLAECLNKRPRMPKPYLNWWICNSTNRHSNLWPHYYFDLGIPLALSTCEFLESRSGNCYHFSIFKHLETEPQSWLMVVALSRVSWFSCHRVAWPSADDWVELQIVVDDMWIELAYWKCTHSLKLKRVGSLFTMKIGGFTSCLQRGITLIGTIINKRLAVKLDHHKSYRNSKDGRL